ncbi:MAG: GAF domain-containing sensor histidine kinase [Anaerolineales bacterium]|nr:GAF domain-containing sensor histidine kinase [Anaerolineales bacterium]
MRTADSPFIADWYTISLRWLMLLGLIVALALGGQLMGRPLALLAVLVSWNISLTILAGLNRRMRYHREISLTIDLLVACFFFGLSGGFESPAFWIGLIPIVTAAIYFEFLGAFIAGGCVILAQVITVALRSPFPEVWKFTAVAGGLTALLAILFGFLSKRVVENLRRTRQENLDSQLLQQRVGNERLRAIYDLTSTLAGTLNYQRVLETALDLSARAMTPDPDTQIDDLIVSAALLFTNEEVLEVVSARRLTSADLRVTLPGKDGAIMRAIEDGEAVRVTEVGRDPELSRIVALHGCADIYCFPLRSGFSVYGVLVFGHPEAGYFAEDRCEVLDIIGRQAIIAMQNARLYQDLVEERDRMIDVQEEARKKLARDLHDGPTQSVAAMAMRVNLARRMMQKDPEGATDELIKIEDLARRTSKEIRHMLFTLRPLVLESQGLVAALKAMAEKMKETYSQEVTVHVDENALKDMEMGKQGVVFYLVEEAVNNARKHARAATIWVGLRLFQHNLALLEIKDDGAGFDVDSVMQAYDQRGSLGMVNLRERAELVNGLLHIESAPGKGTNVQVVIPLTEEAADRLHHARAK